MKLKVFYHICTINHWDQVVREQLHELQASGLYEEADTIYIGVVGDQIDKLKEILKNHSKCEIVRYAVDPLRFEFWTLKIAWHEAQKDEPFFGYYFHTKGVSYPGNSAGDYWRHYMNHYNVREYKEAIKKLRKGFDMCGVKMNEDNLFPPHYSGNFFWFKSTYLRRLPDPEKIDNSFRYNAEFWPCSGEGVKMATLCQDFVDYNTKGSFYPGKTYVHTLAWNLPSEVEKVTRLLYRLNQDGGFQHYIIDLGFPLKQSGINGSISDIKKENTKQLKAICKKYGSIYVQMDNIGVSQNWTQVYKYLNLQDDDVLIGQDPDEHPQSEGWVKAMSDVLRSGFGLAALMMTSHVPLLRDKATRQVAGYNVLKNVQGINWALIGFTGKFLKQMGEVPYPKGAERYGWIEAEVRKELSRYGVDYAVLTDYLVKHTDFELGDEGTSQLLREWKNLIIFERAKYGQISLEEFVKMKIRGLV